MQLFFEKHWGTPKSFAGLGRALPRVNRDGSLGLEPILKAHQRMGGVGGGVLRGGPKTISVRGGPKTMSLRSKDSSVEQLYVKGEVVIKVQARAIYTDKAKSLMSVFGVLLSPRRRGVRVPVGPDDRPGARVPRSAAGRLQPRRLRSRSEKCQDC